ncbi:MAG: hypothetical protein IH865_06445 [Chloroflexi bacterium]|nr:hypothetical protein [Chloroflexota bacterium]
MEPNREAAQPLLVSAEEFLSRLADEIERSDRYEHPFTILTLRPPDSSRAAANLKAEWLESSASGLTRGCDVIATLEHEPILVILLPETDVSGAASLLERLRLAMDDLDQDWNYGLFEYPQNERQLREFMKEAA